MLASVMPISGSSLLRCQPIEKSALQSVTIVVTSIQRKLGLTISDVSVTSVTCDFPKLL